MLGFFSLAILPTNFVGLALVVTALGLLVAEVFITSYGLLTLGGVICLNYGWQGRQSSYNADAV